MIRNYKESDLTYLQQQDFIASLELQYHQDVIKEATVVSEDEDGACHGIVYFRKHYTYEATNEEYNKIVLNIFSEEDEAYQELLTYAKNWLKGQARMNPDKKVCLVTWIESDEKEDLQLYLHNGFFEFEICPCLKYDLENAVDEVKAPSGMTIKKMEFTPEEMDRYITATAEANEGTRDSANELWFTSAGGSCSVYLLMDGEKIVGSTSTWKITEERSAIENIFTTPDYRHQGMAKVIITYALSQAKKEGYSIGTLGVRGRNIAANRLYQSLGFELYYQQIELIYIP